MNIVGYQKTRASRESLVIYDMLCSMGLNHRERELRVVLPS